MKSRHWITRAAFILIGICILKVGYGYWTEYLTVEGNAVFFMQVNIQDDFQIRKEKKVGVQGKNVVGDEKDKQQEKAVKGFTDNMAGSREAEESPVNPNEQENMASADDHKEPQTSANASDTMTEAPVSEVKGSEGMDSETPVSEGIDSVEKDSKAPTSEEMDSVAKDSEAAASEGIDSVGEASSEMPSEGNTSGEKDSKENASVVNEPINNDSAENNPATNVNSDNETKIDAGAKESADTGKENTSESEVITEVGLGRSNSDNDTEIDIP